MKFNHDDRYKQRDDMHSLYTALPLEYRALSVFIGTHQALPERSPDGCFSINEINSLEIFYPKLIENYVGYALNNGINNKMIMDPKVRPKFNENY